MNVFDASAMIAYLRNETGADIVKAQLEVGGVCSAVNWSEVAQKVRSAGADWGLASQLLLSYDLTVEPVGFADAEAAAALWKRGSGLSLADRLCLAMGLRLKARIWTSDRQWAGVEGVTVLR